MITDGDNRAALAITRSLGRAGYQVIVGAECFPNLSAASRYCTQHFLYPDPQRDQEGFLTRIQQTIKQLDPDVLLPVAEVTTLLCAKLKRYLGSEVMVPFPAYDVVALAADKSKVLKTALALDIPIPETIFLEMPTHIDYVAELCQNLGFPVVVKPSRSRYFKNGRWHDTITRYAINFSELAILLDDIPEEVYPVLLQERIVGPGVGIFALMQNDRIIRTFSHRRIREKPPSGGVSVLRESVAFNPVLREHAEKLLHAIGWQGVAMVEFKQDCRHDDDYRLMEINGRFWGSLQLAIDAGVNFPLDLIKSLQNHSLETQTEYRIGVKTRWFWGDMDALLARLFKPEHILKLPSGAPSKLSYFGDFIRLKEKNVNYEVLNLYDPKPWLLESRRWFRALISG